MSTAYLYVGTYTRPAPYLAATNGKGLYVFRFDSTTGELTFASETTGIDNPSYLAIDPRQRFLYANTEVWEWPEGLVSAYAIDPASGGLTYLNKQSSLGWLAAYATVEKSGRWLALVNYMTGNVVLFPCERTASWAKRRMWRSTAVRVLIRRARSDRTRIASSSIRTTVSP